MALHYQTEYRLGDRGRVCRTYTGFQAFIAIAFDLVFGLVFELVFAVIGLGLKVALLTVRLAAGMLLVVGRILVTAMTLVTYAVTLPFAMIHRSLARLRSPAERERPADWRGGGSIRKPSWPLAREV